MMTRDVNGVFKGGGAKGIAYAGALLACEESGLRFREVAGSSAGAITATLVACGYTASETIEMMPRALASIGNPKVAMLKVWRPSLLENSRLLVWLRATINAQVLGPDADPAADCTFAQIEDATGIALYVVTLDLATNQPRVFCPRLTPDSPVAPAVVASSAIPVAFPAARMAVGHDVHRVIDGGTWSNYPAFVFLDDEFRASAGLEATGRPTIGFILDEVDAEPVSPVGSPVRQEGRSLLRDQGSSAHKFRFAGAVLSSTIFRWSLGLIPILFFLLSVAWLSNELNGTTSSIERLPQTLHDFAIVLAIGILATSGLASLAFVFVIVRLGNSLFDSGLVGASAAMGVGPGVAYWVGTQRENANGEPQHVAVRIPVAPELSTLSFTVGSDVQERAVAAGYGATIDAVAPLATERRTTPAGPVLAPVAGRRSPVLRAIGWVLRQCSKRWWLRAILLAYAIVGGTAGAFRVVEGFANESAGEAAIGMLIVGTAIGTGIWLVATMRVQEVTEDNPYRILKRVGTSGRLRFLSLVAGAAAIVLIVASGSDQEHSHFSATRAPRLLSEVVDVQIDDDVSEVELVATADRQPDDRAYSAFLDLVFAADVDEEFVDLVGAEVYAFNFAFDGEITTLDDFDSSELQIALTTLNEVEIGEEVEVGVDIADDTVFLVKDRLVDLESDDSIIGGLVIGLALFILSFRANRAARWLSQQHDHQSPDKPSEPLAPPDPDGLVGAAPVDHQP